MTTRRTFLGALAALPFVRADMRTLKRPTNMTEKLEKAIKIVQYTREDFFCSRIVINANGRIVWGPHITDVVIEENTVDCFCVKIVAKQDVEQDVEVHGCEFITKDGERLFGQKPFRCPIKVRRKDELLINYKIRIGL